MKLDLIFTMRDIHIISNLDPPTKFDSSNRSTNYLPWDIPYMITMTIPISTRKNTNRN